MAAIHCVIPHYGADELLNRAHAAAEVALKRHKFCIHVINNNDHGHGRLFTGACWEGIDTAQRMAGNIDFVWLLNNDAEPEPECIDRALAAFKENQRLGIVAMQNRSHEDRDKVTYGGSGSFFPEGRHKVGPAERFTESTREEWAPFASVVLSGSMVRSIGNLDRRMAHICSDVDYCLRAAWDGWETWHIADSIVRHDFGSSAAPPEWLRNVMRVDTETLRQKHLYFIQRGQRFGF